VWIVDFRYLTEGEVPEYREDNIGFDAIACIEAFVSSSQVPVTVLDVGAAKAGFLCESKKKFGNKVDLHGISAHDYRPMLSQERRQELRNVDYQVGQAEELLRNSDPLLI